MNHRKRRNTTTKNNSKHLRKTCPRTTFANRVAPFAPCAEKHKHLTSKQKDTNSKKKRWSANLGTESKPRQQQKIHNQHSKVMVPKLTCLWSTTTYKPDKQSDTKSGKQQRREQPTNKPNAASRLLENTGRGVELSASLQNVVHEISETQKDGERTNSREREDKPNMDTC